MIPNLLSLFVGYYAVLSHLFCIAMLSFNTITPKKIIKLILSDSVLMQHNFQS